MLNQKPFYHELIKKYTIAIGTFLSDLTIERKDGNKKKIQSIKIPCAYAPKEKWLTRLLENPDLTKQIKMDLPRISFELVGFEYDSSRKIGPNQNYLIDKESGKISTPAPWNFNYMVYVATRTQDDMMNILEQMLSFFSPAVTFKISVLDNPKQVLDIPFIFNQVQLQDNWDTNFEDQRIIVASLSFTIKGYLFGPITDGKIIKKSIADVSQSNNLVPANTYTATVNPFNETQSESDPHTIDEEWKLNW